MHALIVGGRGVGKSTLIRSVLSQLGRPVFGYETKKETALEDDVNGSPVHIYEAGKPHAPTAENLVGHCKTKHAKTMKEGFDRFAPKLSAPVPEGHVVELDEIGFMESQSADFCAAILALLDGNTPVIAAVKDKDTAFLQQVRSHKNCRRFDITPENRDELQKEVLAFMEAQLKAE